MRTLILAATAVAMSGGSIAQQDWQSMERPSDWDGDWWTCEQGSGAILRNPRTNVGGFVARMGDEVMAVDLIFSAEPYRPNDIFAWKKEGGLGLMIRANGLVDVFVHSTTNAPGAVMQINCSREK